MKNLNYLLFLTNPPIFCFKINYTVVVLLSRMKSGESSDSHLLFHPHVILAVKTSLEANNMSEMKKIKTFVSLQDNVFLFFLLFSIIM